MSHQKRVPRFAVSHWVDKMTMLRDAVAPKTGRGEMIWCSKLSRLHVLNVHCKAILWLPGHHLFGHLMKSLWLLIATAAARISDENWDPQSYRATNKSVRLLPQWHLAAPLRWKKAQFCVEKPVKRIEPCDWIEELFLGVLSEWIWCDLCAFSDSR